LLGKAAVNRITLLAVCKWPSLYAESLDAQDELCRSIVTQMRDYKGYDRKYGSIWIILLSAVVGQIVRALLEWWLNSRDNQKAMASLKTGYRKELECQ
jgi:hypothetical protein